VSRGGETELPILIEQLLEEYPGLSPDRADAALRLTRQNGHYSLYRAAAVLPGAEGAPLEISDASSMERSDGQAASGGSTSDWVDPGSEGSDAQASEGEGACKPQAKFTRHNDDDDGADHRGCDHHHHTGACWAQRVGAMMAKNVQGNGDKQKAGRTGGAGGREAAQPHDAVHHCGPRDQQAAAPATTGQEGATANVPRAPNPLQFAAQVVSIASGKTLQEAYEVVQKQIALHGDMGIATQRACQELMDGPVDQKAKEATPANELPDNGGASLAEREFGPGARRASVSGLAKRARSRSGEDENGDSPPRPERLFDRRLNEELHNAGGGLTASQRLATAMRRTEQSLYRDARDARFHTSRRTAEEEDEMLGDGTTPASAALVQGSHTLGGITQQRNAPAPTTTSSQRAASHASPAVRVAEQMRMKQERAAGASQGSVIVVNSAGAKLPVWKAGAEAEGRGFTWKTKQRMVHAWEQYQLSEGLHAPKSFKSMIDQDLVPLICAECNLEEGDWEMLDDVTLLSAIEERLKPHDAMDFTVQLKQIIFEKDESKGSLTQRYRLFAEPFLAKISEAKAAGCQLQENVVKLTFSRAVQASPVLQAWLEQYKWTSVGETHRRITNQLKVADAYQTLIGISGTPTGHQARQQPAQHQQHQQQPVQQQQQQQQGQQQQAPQQGQRAARFNQQVQAAVNAAMQAFQQANLQQQGGGAAPPAAVGGGHVNYAQQQRAPMSAFPGLDSRGPSWHVHSQLLGCRSFPCLAPFCQACAVHHHTADECRKRQYNNPGVNTSGYWSEQKPNCAPLRSTKPPAGAGVNVAVQSPAFPVPYFVNGGGAAAPAQAGQSVQQQGAVNIAAQQPPQPPREDGAGGNQ